MSKIITPKRSVFVPREYQHMIVNHVLGLKRKCVWAGMGLGKTVSTFTALDIDFIAGRDNPVLIVAPKRVALTTWPDEARKWSHLRQITVMPIVGSENDRRRSLRYDASVYTTNFENLPWLIDYYGERWPFKHVVVDESTKLKNFRTKQGGVRAQKLGSIAHTHIKEITLLTGTPAPNGLHDLWGQLWFVDAGKRLGRSFSDFEDRWFRYPKYGEGGPEAMPHSHAEIQERLKDVCLTIKAEDWFDLKKPIVNNIMVQLPPKARALYKEMKKNLFLELGQRSVTAANAASKSQKLLQLASGAVYLDPLQDEDVKGRTVKDWKEVHDAKLEALEDIMEEANGESVLVAYYFKSDLARILKWFPYARVCDDDPQTQREWNAGKIRMMLGQPASIGHGLNLQDGGRTIVFFSQTWNLEHRLQILERIGPVRQLQAGLDRNVFIHNILSEGTMDEDVIERVETKKSVMDILMDAMKRD